MPIAQRASAAMRVGPPGQRCRLRALDALGDAGARSTAFSVALRSLRCGNHASEPRSADDRCAKRRGGLKFRMCCACLAERRTSVPGVAGALVFAGVDLAAAGALAGFGDATALAGALVLRPAAFLAGRPKPSAIATSVRSSASALPASTGGVMYGAAASTSDASCGGTIIGVELQEWSNGHRVGLHRRRFSGPGRDPAGAQRASLCL